MVETNIEARLGKLAKRLVRLLAPAEVAEEIIQQGESYFTSFVKNREIKRQDASVIVVNIHGYTSLAERLNAEELTNLLSDFYECAAGSILEQGGASPSFIGNTLMATVGEFDSVLKLEDHAWRAVQGVIQVRQRLAERNVQRIASQKPTIDIGIGVNSGTVISGIIGSERYSEIATFGDCVNLSFQLERATKQSGCDILISEATYQRCIGRVEVRELSPVHFNGRNESVRVYELIGVLMQ